MKKTVNRFIFITTVLLILAISGCSNVIASNNSVKTDKVDVKTALADAVADGKDVDKNFTVTGIKLNGQNGGSFVDFKDADYSKLEIEFNLNISEDILKNILVYPIDFSKITDAASEEIYNRKAALTPYKSSVYENKATLYFDLNNEDAIEVFFDAAKVCAKNGQKLDLDGDFLQGETDDDGCVYFIDSNYSGTMYGVSRAIPFVAFKISVSTPVFDIAAGTVTCVIDAFGEDAAKIFKNHFAVQYEKLNASGKVTGWETVSTTGTYDSVTEEYKLTWTPVEKKNLTYRVLLTDADTIITEKEYDGYKRKYSLDGRVKTVELASYYYTDAAYASDTEFFSEVETINNELDQIVKVVFTINTANNSYNGSEYYAEVCGIKGFTDVEDSKKLDRFLLIADNGDTMFWPSYKLLKSNKVMYGANADKELYTTYTFIFDKPITLNNSYTIYADPSLKIQFQENDGLSDGDIISYEIGYDGNNNLCYRYVKVGAAATAEEILFNKLIKEYGTTKVVTVPSADYCTASLSIRLAVPEGKKARLKVLQNGSSGSFDAVFWLYKEGNTTANLLTGGSGLRDGDVNYVMSEPGFYELRIGPWSDGSSGNVYMTFTEE